MKRFLSSVLMLSVSLAMLAFPATHAQEPAAVKPQPVSAPLTNNDILEMLKAGLTADVVVAKIKSSAANFDTSPAALAELKAANVPDAVILAMVSGPTADTGTGSTEPDPLVNVPDGTEVEIQLTNNASGEELKVGAVVDFTVVKAVQMNGVTVFEKDAAARARITTAKRAGHWGKAGKLEWAMQDVLAVLGPVALLWGLKKGKPAIIPAGNRYNVFISGDVKIKGKPAAVAKQP